MRFWDSSALVPLVCRETDSAKCRSWLRADPVVVVWALAATEVISALSRKRREDALSGRTFASAKRRLAKLETAWSEVTYYDAVRARARRLLEVHVLGAADALHLAAALVAVEDRTSHVGFVSFDRRLNEAAEKEGFAVLPQSS
jgi:predicted nucleic acid-binding protein